MNKVAPVAYLRAMRAKAVAAGDLAQARAIDRDLERQQSPVARSYGIETADAVGPVERAVPPLPKRRGRPPKREN